MSDKTEKEKKNNVSDSLNFIKTFSCLPSLSFILSRLEAYKTDLEKGYGIYQNHTKTVSLWIAERVHRHSLSINCKIQVEIDKLPE